METSPEVLLSSRRIGPLTLSVRSKLPLADGPIAQPALARAANNKHARPADLRSVIVPPCEFRAKAELASVAVKTPSKGRYGNMRNYVPNGRGAQVRFGCESDSFSEPWR